MSVKPILFNTEMVQAILDGRKTATRRAVKPQFALDADGKEHAFGGVGGNMFIWTDKPNIKTVIHPPYRPGDILYVRETWTQLWYVDQDGYTHYDQPMYYYAADGVPDITLMDADGFECDDQRIRWHPSIHMPKEAARLFLRVTDVRVERLKNITDKQAGREGIREFWIGMGESGYAVSADSKTFYDGPIGAFAHLWNSCARPSDLPLYGWEANPWVWVIEFERISKEAVPEEARDT